MMLYNNQLKHTAPLETSFKIYVYTVYTDTVYSLGKLTDSWGQLVDGFHKKVQALLKVK